MPKENKALANNEKQKPEDVKPTSSKNTGVVAAAVGVFALITLAALHHVGKKERKKSEPGKKSSENSNSFFESDIVKNIQAGAKKVADDTKDFTKSHMPKNT